MSGNVIRQGLHPAIYAIQICAFLYNPFVRSIFRTNPLLFGVAMFEQVIVDQNSHWKGSFYFEGIRRETLAKVISLLDLPHILSIVGVRRAGKSTLVKQTINYLIRDRGVDPDNILFLNLETPQFSRFRNDIASLEQAFEDYLKLVTPEGMIYCFLDEAQFFPEWHIFVKSRYEQKNIKFIVTGSNSSLLSSELITLLSGRTLPITVFPFSFSEFVRYRQIDVSDQAAILRERHLLRNAFDWYLVNGGFPETAFIESEQIRKEILIMYARNILYQDITPRFGIKKALELENLFYYLTSNVASIFTYNRLSSLVSLNDKTIKDFLSYFSDAYLLFTMDAYGFSIREQIKSPKKVYVIDTGMARATAFGLSENTGHYIENIVFLELKRREKKLFYYRTANGLEVDFAIQEGNRLTELIQVARDMKDEKTRARELKALLKAMEETRITSGTIITHEDEDEITVEGKTVRIIPGYRYLLSEGAG